MSVLAPAYLVLRAAAVWGRTPARFPDTVGYLVFEPLSPHARLWPVTLVYAVVRNDALRVAFQVLAGAAAWTWLARETSAASRFPTAARIAVLVVGLCPQVVRYDLAVLSESLTITLAVGVVAASLAAVRSSGAGTSVAATVLFITFCMARQQHLPLLFLAAAAVLLVASARRRVPTVRGIVLVAAAVVGAQQLSSSSSLSTLNMYTVLSDRVINNDDRFAWFVAQGMPDIPGMREAGGYDFVEQVPAELAARVQLPEGQAPPSLIRVGGAPLLDWVQERGWSTYARFVLTHPADTRARLSGLAGPVLQPPNDDFLPLDTRTITPRWLFPPWKVSVVVSLFSVAAAFLSGRRRYARCVILLLGSTAALYAVAVLGSGIEHPRHGAVSAVLLVVTALVAVTSAAPRRHATELP